MCRQSSLILYISRWCFCTSRFHEIFFSKFKYIFRVSTVVVFEFWRKKLNWRALSSKRRPGSSRRSGPTSKSKQQEKISRNFEEFLNIIFKEEKSGRLVINASSNLCVSFPWMVLTIWEDFSFKLWSRILISKEKFKVRLISKSWWRRSYSPNMQLLYCVGN